MAKEIENLPKDIESINVFINSYGGEVAEGLAIYNVLRRHPAKVQTYCDGFACSIASVVFMAGDARIMSNASLLMIHKAWMYTGGNSAQLRKDADDLEIITKASIKAYMEHLSITEEELIAMLDAETWVTPEDALEMGFATTIVNPVATNKASASLHLRKDLMEMILSRQTKDPGPVVSDFSDVVSKLDVLIEKLEPQAVEADPTPDLDPAPENKLPKLLAALFAKKGEEVT